MVDLTDQEQAAIRAAIKPLAEAIGEIGWGTRCQHQRAAGPGAD